MTTETKLGLAGVSSVPVYSREVGQPRPKCQTSHPISNSPLLNVPTCLPKCQTPTEEV